MTVSAILYVSIRTTESYRQGQTLHVGGAIILSKTLPSRTVVTSASVAGKLNRMKGYVLMSNQWSRILRLFR